MPKAYRGFESLSLRKFRNRKRRRKRMHQLIDITKPNDILPEYRETPIGLLLEYHNMNRHLDTYTQAKLLIGMCMDNRKHLQIPDNFAFIIRSAGANLRY